LNEIFVDKDYHFETSKKSIIIDIGANVGIASIFFSSNKYIEKIYAFEPVKPTFDQAKRNIEFNHLSEKINIMNFGLGDEDKTLIFKFDSNSKGSAGVSSIKNDRYKNNKNAIDISVEIKNSNEVFEKIIYKYPSHQIIVKMDCEGAENEILKSLIKKQLINKINCFILEWHHDNYSFVTNILLENNFSFFTKSNNYNSGLVLAYKNQTE
jgi:FkbM family methyltransferase